MSEPVDVDDGAQVVQLVKSGEVQSLPHVPLHRLAVAHQTVGPIKFKLVNILKFILNCDRHLVGIKELDLLLFFSVML